MAAVDDLHQATGRDLNLVGGRNIKPRWGRDMDERSQGGRNSVTAVSQRSQASKTWLGSEKVNVLQFLCDLLDLLQAMSTHNLSSSAGTVG